MVWRTPFSGGVKNMQPSSQLPWKSADSMLLGFFIFRASLIILIKLQHYLLEDFSSSLFKIWFIVLETLMKASIPNKNNLYTKIFIFTISLFLLCYYEQYDSNLNLPVQQEQ